MAVRAGLWFHIETAPGAAPSPWTASDPDAVRIVVLRKRRRVSR